ncbi:DotI/IcmL family type IV secretion protein [Pseudomonas aeruginosa]
MSSVNGVLAAVVLLVTAQAEAASEPHPVPLLKFHRDCVIKAFQLNYGSFERQLQDLHVACMTDRAYIDWRSSLDRAGYIDQLKNGKDKLVLAANVGAGTVIADGVRELASRNRYTATIKSPIQIVLNGDTSRARYGFIETDVIRVRQNDRIVGYAIHAIRLNISK